MVFTEFPLGNQANAPMQHDNGALGCFRSSSFSESVEGIWDCDIPDGNFAKTLMIKCAPGTSLWVINQYRKPAEIRQGTQLLPPKLATQIQSDSVILQPTGALGIILVCLRSDAAGRLVKAPLKEFANANIHLADVFSARDVAMCDDMLAGAGTSKERIAVIQSLLIRRLRPHAPDVTSRAALHLSEEPTMQMHALAEQLGVSERHLSRAFNGTYGVSPKRFARLARFQKILAERRKGSSWAQIAHACGLTDQAHLAKEFRDIAGQSATEFFAHGLCIGPEKARGANLILQHTRTADRCVTQR